MGCLETGDCCEDYEQVCNVQCKCNRFHIVRILNSADFVNHPCYCDEGCLETGDCCEDYELVCNVQCKCNRFRIVRILFFMSLYHNKYVA